MIPWLVMLACAPPTTSEALPPPPYDAVATRVTPPASGSISEALTVETPTGQYAVYRQLGVWYTRAAGASTATELWPGWKLVDVADIDGDGVDDLVLDGLSLLALDVRTGAVLLDVPWPADLGAGGIGDLDGDGTLEVVHLFAATMWDHRLRVYDLDGVLLAEEPVVGRPARLWVGQYDDDAPLEVWVDSGAIYEGPQLARESWPVPNADLRDTCDVDGDGSEEFLVRLAGQYIVRGSQGTLWTHSVQEPDVWDARLRDVDGDGDCEAFVPVSYGYLQLDGATGAIEQALSRWPRALHCSPLFAADLDGDGMDELGCRTFDVRIDPDAGVVRSTNPLPDDGVVRLADVDGDGDDELVYLGRAVTVVDPETLAVLSDQRLTPWSVPSVAALADVDGDGADDLVLTSSGAEAFRWTPQGFVPTGRLLPASVQDAISGPRLVDVDGDGDLDLVGAINFVVSWLDFATGAIRWTGTSGELADLDRDGAYEILQRTPSGTVTIRELTTGAVRGTVDGSLPVVVDTPAQTFLLVNDRDTAFAAYDLWELGASGPVLRTSFTLPDEDGFSARWAGGRLWYRNADGGVGWSPYDGTTVLLPGSASADIAVVGDRAFVGGDEVWQLP